MTVYLLVHLRLDEQDEDLKICGIYSSLQKAESARQRLAIQPGFKDFLGGFEISEFDMDKDEWTEGFGINVADYP